MDQRDEEDAVTVAGAIRWTELCRYDLDEMEADERASFEARLAEDPSAKARLDALRAGHRTAQARLNVPADTARILERLEAPKRRSWLPALFVAAAAAAGAVVVIGTQEGPATTRTKGLAPALQMYVNDMSGPRLVSDGVRLEEGDAIQFRYRADGRPYLFVVSVDAAGAVSPLYPDAPTQSIRVDPEGTNVLEGSVILDDAVGPERVHAVFSRTPLRFDELKTAIDRARAGGTDVTSLPRIGIERDDVLEASVLIIKE